MRLVWIKGYVDRDDPPFATILGLVLIIGGFVTYGFSRALIALLLSIPISIIGLLLFFLVYVFTKRHMSYIHLYYPGCAEDYFAYWLLGCVIGQMIRGLLYMIY